MRPPVPVDPDRGRRRRSWCKDSEGNGSRCEAGIGRPNPADRVFHQLAKHIALFFGDGGLKEIRIIENPATESWQGSPYLTGSCAPSVDVGSLRGTSALVPGALATVEVPW